MFKNNILHESMKKENTLNLNQFLCFDGNETENLFSSEIGSNEDIETFILNQRDYSNVDIGYNVNLLKNVNQNSKNVDKEIYRPKHVRGHGIHREGYCESCNQWFKLKTSSYWYHMNYKHGINSKGKKYPEPQLREVCQKIESYCSFCNQWIYLCTINGRKSIKYTWYKHFQKIHADDF